MDGPAPGPAPPKRARVLVVDDEVENVNLVKRLLRGHHDVLTAANAEQALALFEDHAIDLVLCDQRMPGPSGVELLEQVRLRWPRTARVLVTAYSDLDSAIDAINRGQVRRYLRKPWDNDELVALVDQELEVVRLQAVNERLASDLSSRHAELHKAHEELRSLDRMKTNLLASVTHELKTPLLSIQGYTEMLLAGRGGPVPEQAASFLEGILRSAQRLEDLVGNLLLGARMEFEGDTLSLSKVDIAARARHAAKSLGFQAKKKGVTVDIVADEEVGLIADPQAIDRILLNLLTNAIKFNVPGGNVRLELLPRDEEVEIVVADTGCGIAADHLPRIFDRFYKIEDPATPKYGGTGIGLSIVKESVERHGGTIEVESLPEKGTTFRVHMPSIPVHAEEAPDGDPAPEPGDLMLLLGDPHPEDLEAERAKLLARGYDVLAVPSLQEVIQKAHRHFPHAILLDISLVDEDPHLPTSLRVPWMALLPQRDPDMIRRALRGGALGCLLKPLRPDEVQHLLQEGLF